MKNEKRSKSWFVALMTVAAIAVGVGETAAQTPRVPVVLTQERLQKTEWRVMDVLAQLYGDTDFSSVADYMAANPEDSGNPNIAFIPLSLANVYLNRYEWRNHIADFERSIASLEWVAQNHALWGDRWLSAPVTGYLDLTLVRLRSHRELTQYRDRLDALWNQALAITQEEADGRLTSAYPSLPYDSSTTGDTKAEEDAWDASLLAAAANFLPEHAHADAWETKAKELAYDAITRPSDPPDAEGIKTTTVTEDFALSNHGFFPNPTYTAATILMLEQGALTYRLSGRDVPMEFGHNVAPLYEIYKGYVNADLTWTVPSDPPGDAALFPFAFDSQLEKRAIARLSETGSLWIATQPVETMQVGDPLWTAVLNSKAVAFYMVGSYLWHFPPAVVGPTVVVGTSR